MRAKIPQRRIKVWIRLAVIMGGLFFATIAVCAITFFFTRHAQGIISPIYQNGHEISSRSAVTMVKMLCQNDHISCSSVSVNGDTMTIDLDNSAVAYLSTKKDFKTQLASLQQVASQLTIKGKQFKTLDLRFDHIIVSF